LFALTAGGERRTGATGPISSYCSASPSRDGDSRRQSATTRVWGSIGSAEIFAEGTAHTMTKWDAHCAGLASRCRQVAVGGWWGLEYMRARDVEW
jgi:hypothetical protein